jgi:hypothetical protein
VYNRFGSAMLAAAREGTILAGQWEPWRQSCVAVTGYQ